MLDLLFIGKENFPFLLFVGVVSKACPVALHEGVKGLLKVRVDDYLLQFVNDGIEPEVIWVFVLS